jgi:rhodanese-related sulfurtransferase
MLAIVAVSAGVLAPFAGSPYRAGHAAIDVDAITHAIATERDHVTAIELAAWIRDRRPGLRLLDVGGAAGPEGGAPGPRDPLPGAVDVPIASLAKAASAFRLTDTIVVYSDGGAHGAQAWVLLRALGFRNVFFLQGGRDAWVAEVLSPAISPTASASERAAFERTLDLSRYFGGEPRVADGPPQRRRGC